MEVDEKKLVASRTYKLAFRVSQYLRRIHGGRPRYLAGSMGITSRFPKYSSGKAGMVWRICFPKGLFWECKNLVENMLFPKDSFEKAGIILRICFPEGFFWESRNQRLRKLGVSIFWGRAPPGCGPAGIVAGRASAT